ncbi:unnamed protein product [Agarophyton chilense]
MPRSAAVVEDDTDIVVVETVPSSPPRDRHLAPHNVIVLDNSRPPPRTTNSSIEPIVIDEAPRKRRRRDQSSSHPSSHNPVSHPQHVIIVDDSDSPPHRPSLIAFRGRETQTSRIERQRIHLHQRNASPSPYEEDIIEMAVSGPRLAPEQPPPPPPILNSGETLVQPSFSMTPNIPPPANQRQSMPPWPDLNSPFSALNRLPDSATSTEQLGLHNLQLPSIPAVEPQPRSQSHPTERHYTPHLVELDQILARNHRISSHRHRDYRNNTDASQFTPALRPSSVHPSGHLHRHPHRHNPTVSHRYIHLERDQGGSTGPVLVPGFVRVGAVRREHTSQSNRPSRYSGDATASPYAASTGFFPPSQPRLNPLRQSDQSDANQFSQNVDSTADHLESRNGNHYAAATTNMNTAISDSLNSPAPHGATPLQAPRAQFRRHTHTAHSGAESDGAELAGYRELRHLQRRRDHYRSRQSPRRMSTARPLPAVSPFANVARNNLLGAQRLQRQAAMRARARSQNPVPHRHSHHHITAVLNRMLNQVGGPPVEIHYFHGLQHPDHSLDYERLIRLDDQLIREKNRAERDQIDSLPVKKATTEDKEIRCCICMCDVEEGEDLRVLPCAHKYHKSCIDEWLTYNGCCPVDKKRIAPSRPRRRCARHS